MIRHGKCGCNWQTQLQEPSAGRSASPHPDGVSRIRATLPTSSDVTKFELSGAVPSRAGRGPQLPASEGSALGFSQAESAFLERVKGGHFDDLLQRCCPVHRGATPAMNTGPVPPRASTRRSWRFRRQGGGWWPAPCAGPAGRRHGPSPRGRRPEPPGGWQRKSTPPEHPGETPPRRHGPAKFANRELFDRNGTT